MLQTGVFEIKQGFADWPGSKARPKMEDLGTSLTRLEATVRTYDSGESPESINAQSRTRLLSNDP
jgi:hypothetical protein